MTDAAAATLAAAALKLPPFYTQNAEFWFVFCESQFLLKSITADATKFAHVVTSLPEEAASRIRKKITNAPSEGKYEYLKHHLLKEFSLSKTERAAALLDLSGLGDMKPSQLLSRMEDLLPDDEEKNFLFRELFLRQLPSDVRAHLADKEEMDLDNLALEADRFYTTAGLRVAAVQHHKPRQANKTELCYFHKKFGNAARNCWPPCSYVPGN